MFSMYLLALDPGDSTGATLFHFEDGNVQIIWSREIDEYEIDFVVEDTISLYRGQIEVVSEKFTITPQTGKLSAAPWSLEKTGVSRYLARKYKAKYTIQLPVDAKNFCPNRLIKALGLWVVIPGGEGHALDSIRHGVLYMVKNFNWRPSALLDTDDDEDE